MDLNEKISRLRLARTRSVGVITFFKLLERFGTAERSIDKLPEIARRGGRLSNVDICSKDDALAELENIERFGARLIAYGEEGYPELLAQLEDPPPLITVKGNLDIISKPALGVVGARNASVMGKKLCAELASSVSEAGIVITSGLARGIDTVAHKAAINNGTVAVVAGGIDVIYPPENEGLFKEIVEKGGAIVAESPFGAEPMARHFPRRNRIISGLSLGVLVVEAAVKSGSLITARTALEQNREVFAVPGSPKDPRSEGTNKLIKDGAHMVTSAEDIISELESRKIRPFRDRGEPDLQGFLPLDDFETIPDFDQAIIEKILENLSYAPVQINELIRELNLPAPKVMTAILELELEGRVERHLGNKISLI